MGRVLQATEIYDHLRALDQGWVNWETTTDRFLAGDPNEHVRGIAVAWMPYTWALKQARDLGCNVVVAHEPLFYGPWHQEAIARMPGVRAKRTWIEQSGMIILRCHDVWDQMPDIGVPDTWATQLGLANPVYAEGFFRLFDVAGQTARSVAAGVARATSALGQQAVQLIGPPEKRVSRLALGTGAITPLAQFILAVEADIALCTDDGFTYWDAGALAVDLEMPVIVVNHAVSELPAMESLARHLADRFPQIPVHLIPQSCMYHLITAGE